MFQEGNHLSEPEPRLPSGALNQVIQDKRNDSQSNTVAVVCLGH